MKRAWSAEEIRALGVRTDLETAASVFGLGKTKAYELARSGNFPSPVLRIGNKYVVLVTPMLRALGIEDAAGAETGGHVVHPRDDRWSSGAEADRPRDREMAHQEPALVEGRARGAR